MSYLEDIISGIEISSGIELPQEEKEDLQELIDAHQFDQEAVTQFVDYYTNINKSRLPEKIIEIFHFAPYYFANILVPYEPGEEPIVEDQRIEELNNYIGLHNHFLKRAIKLMQLTLDKLIESFKIEGWDKDNYSVIESLQHPIQKSLKTFLADAGLFLKRCNITTSKHHNSRNIIDKYLDIWEKLVIINANALIPFHRSANEDLEQYNNKHFASVLAGKWPEPTTSIDNLNILYQFLEKLSQYKIVNTTPTAYQTPTRYNNQFASLITSTIEGNPEALLKVKHAIKVLDSHNPEKDDLPDVFEKIIKSIKNKILPIPDYEIIEFLGDGSYKRTYRAKHLNFDQDVALKIIDIPTLAQQPNMQRIIKIKLGNNFNGNIEEALVKIFQEEAKVMFKATTKRSPNIPIIFEAKYDATTKQYRIVEELGDQTLAQVLIQKKKLGPIPADHYLSQISDGVKQLHSLGFVHGDIKPENILVNKDNSIRIIDFGWSSQIPLLSEHYDDPRYLTNLLTCAPEIFDGKHPDEKSDMWSVGVIAYKMMTGEWPFNHGFTGTEQKWRSLTLDEKQRYTRQIREDIENKKYNRKYLDRLKSGHTFDEEHQFYITDRANFERFIENLFEFVSNTLQHDPSSRILKTELLGQR